MTEGKGNKGNWHVKAKRVKHRKELKERLRKTQGKSVTWNPHSCRLEKPREAKKKDE